MVWCPVSRIKPHCEVSTTFKKWHIAYHGTSVGALRRTLDLSQLLPGLRTLLSSPLLSSPLLLSIPTFIGSSLCLLSHLCYLRPPINIQLFIVTLFCHFVLFSISSSPQIHTSIHPYIQTIHPSIHPSIHSYIHINIHTYKQTNKQTNKQTSIHT